MPLASTSADRSFSVDDRDHVASAGGMSSLVSTAFPSVQFPVVTDGVDTVMYARAVSAAAANRTGGADGGKHVAHTAPPLVVC